MIVAGIAQAIAQTFTITLLPTTLPAATQGTPYNATISAVGGVGPYTFAVTGGSLPGGLSLAADGTITGTPASSGASSFTVTATDTGSGGNTGFRDYTFNTGTNSLSLTAPPLANGIQGTAYNQSVTASGGTGPYTYSVSSGSLPPGLSINAGSGAITGTPTTGGSYNFTIHAIDSVGNTGSQAYAVNIGTNSLSISPTTLPNGTQGVAYSQSVTASGGTGPYAYSVSSGSLPTGLSLNAGSGAITGTPTASGPFSFTVHAVDSVNNFGNRTYNVNIGTVSLTVNPASLPNGTIGTAYNQTVSATGGTGPYSFSIIAGSLPAGLSLNAGTGAITGTPSAAGTSNFTVQAGDSLSNSGTRAYSVSINAAPLTVNPSSLPAATQGAAYSQTITASGGTAPYSYLVLNGSLPPGLSLSGTTGVLSGTPTAGGTYSFTVQATDATPNVGTRAYTLTVGTNSLTLNPTSLPPGTQGVAYAQTVSASGGTGPYSYTITSGALPAGLTLNASTGTISGTPSGSGSSSFTVQAQDSLGNFGSRGYAVNIGTNSLTINPASLPAATQGAVYRQTVTASGGAGPYTYSIASGALPPGLSLDGTSGVISGTPSALGSATFVITAFDSAGNFGTRSYTITTDRPNPALDPRVQALVASQAATSRRFADAQVSNVMSHLESLHDHFDPCAVDMGINLPVYDLRPSDVPDSLLLYPTPQSTTTQAQPARQPNDCSNRPSWARGFSVWAGGGLDFGSATSAGQLVKNRFSTGGLTAGVDARVLPNLIVGTAVGYGTDQTDIGADGTRSIGSSFNAIIYGSYKPIDSWFVDALLGYGGLGFDNRRLAPIDAALVSGTRSGSSLFSSLSLGTEWKVGAAKLAPYVRADFMSMTLKAYSEQGPALDALSFGAVSFNSVSGAFGMRGFYDIAMSWGVLTPMMRLEYRYAFDGGFAQSMYYTDLGPSLSYVLNQADTSRNLFSAAIGVRARIGAASTFDLEYGTSATAGNFQAQSIRANLKVAF